MQSVIRKLPAREDLELGSSRKGSGRAQTVGQECTSPAPTQSGREEGTVVPASRSLGPMRSPQSMSARGVAWPVLQVVEVQAQEPALGTLQAVLSLSR